MARRGLKKGGGGRFMWGWTQTGHFDFTLAESAGNVFLRCPPSSVVERVLGKNEVTGSIPVGGSEWRSPRLCRKGAARAFPFVAV